MNNSQVASEVAARATQKYNLPDEIQGNFQDWLSHQIFTLPGPVADPGLGHGRVNGWGCGGCSDGAVSRANQSGKATIENHILATHQTGEVVVA